MAKLLELEAESKEELCLVGKALSSPTRIDIIKLLSSYSLNIAEISEKLDIPASSAAMHVRVLEEANLINTEVQPGERGSMKLCSRKHDYITICLLSAQQTFNETLSVSMPIGAYTACEIMPTCGLATDKESVGMDDKPASFYLPERIHAQIIWFSSGYIEYKFPLPIPFSKIRQLSFSMEVCSEAPNFREDWKSDITLWVEGVECGTWTSPGDFGARRGRLTPSWWANGNTQYGLLTTWALTENENFINGNRVEGKGLSTLLEKDQTHLTLRIGNKSDARYIGGVNLFGEQFGDYPQSIVMTIVH